METFVNAWAELPLAPAIDEAVSAVVIEAAATNPATMTLKPLERLLLLIMSPLVVTALVCYRTFEAPRKSRHGSTSPRTLDFTIEGVDVIG
jgi:hypothetical protein